MATWAEPAGDSEVPNELDNIDAEHGKQACGASGRIVDSTKDRRFHRSRTRKYQNIIPCGTRGFHRGWGIFTSTFGRRSTLARYSNDLLRGACLLPEALHQRMPIPHKDGGRLFSLHNGHTTTTAPRVEAAGRAQSIPLNHSREQQAWELAWPA